MALPAINKILVLSMCVLGHRPSCLLLCELFHFFAALDLIHKNFGWLKAWDKVLVDDKRSITGDVSRDFLLTLLVDKTSKTADIYVIAV